MFAFFEEQELCKILNEKPQIPPLPADSPEGCSNIPSGEEIQRYEDLIEQLQAREVWFFCTASW